MSLENRGAEQISKAEFRELFEKEFPRLILLANYYVDKATAEDVVQDVFVHLWNHWGKLSTHQNLLFWLSTAVKNRCLNILRHQKIQQKNMLHLAAEETSSTDTDEYEILGRIEKIKNAIEQLPAATRDVLKLNMYEELSYNEIAFRLSISKNTVKYHLKLAYKSLRGSLDKPGHAILFHLLIKK